MGSRVACKSLAHLALGHMLYILFGLAYIPGHSGIMGLVFQDLSMPRITHRETTPNQ